MTKDLDFGLRRWLDSDLDSLISYANNIKLAANLTNKFVHPYTKESGEWFIAYANSHDIQQIFAIDIDGEAIGAIGVHPQEDIFCKNGELGYWLAEPFWGRGIMTEAIRRIVNYGFAAFDLDRIFARPFGRNVGSQRALEKAGFTLEAKLRKTIFKMGKFEDEWIYGIRNSDLDT